MTIGIDARLYGTGLGLGRYVSQLVLHLEQTDMNNQYVIFLRKDTIDRYTPRNPRFRKVCADVRWYSLAEQLVMPFYFIRAGCDLVHIPHFNAPLLYPGRMLVTIHDLILMKHPQSATVAATTRSPVLHWIKYHCFRLVVRVALIRACRIIAVSRSVANDIREYAPSVHSKLFVVYEAAQSLGRAREPLRCASRGGRCFFLYAGNCYPHKNLPTLLDAFALFHARMPFCSLILCGQEDFFQKQLVAQIEKRGYTPFVNHVGMVLDEELAWLYEHARALVLPSQEEGFGLQILEAFIHGCPVIASSISPYEEIAGGAAFHCDTRKPAALVDALEALVPDCDMRTQLIERGKKRARDFSWEQTARETLILYTACL